MNGFRKIKAAPPHKASPADKIDWNKVILVLGNLYFTYLLIRGVYYGYITYQLQTAGKITSGAVVAHLEVPDIRPHIIRYKPVIEYRVDGRVYTRVGRFPTGNPDDYKIDDPVPILFNPSDPQTGRIDEWGDIWFYPGFLLLFSPCALILTNFILIRAWVKNRLVLDFLT